MPPENREQLPRQFSSDETISRADLISAIDTASEGCTQSTRDKLHAVAETTDAVAVGWFHYQGCRCPARQAGRHNQRFQEAFDRAMCERYGREWHGDDDVPRFSPVDPFLVRVA